MNQQLTDLFQRKQEQSKSGVNIDWDSRRNEYLAAVNNLYEQIDTILAEPLHKKMVTLQRREKQLTEDFIGTYSAKDLILTIGNEQVRLSPRGRNIVGAFGRVDVLGERGEAALVLQPDSTWGFVQTRQPTLRIVPFDESTFAEVLKIVMRA